MSELAATFRPALQRLVRHPWYTLATVVCLTLGIGANTGVFSVVNPLLLRPLPFPNADRLVYVYNTYKGGIDVYEPSLLDYSTLRSRGQSIEAVGIATQRSFNLAQDGPAEHVIGAAMTADYLGVLGVQPILGRTVTAEDDRPGAPLVALIGHGLWQRRFGGDPGILGRTLRLGGNLHTIVGVLPAGFDVPLRSEIWVPLALNIDTLPLGERLVGNYFMKARLKPGVTIEQGRAELRLLARDLAVTYPVQRTVWGTTMAPLRDHFFDDVAALVQPGVLLLLGVVGLLLLLACGNVASLLLARAIERGHDLAVQVAVGADRRRLARELLAENIIVSVVGGVLGLGLAVATVRPLMKLGPIRPNALAASLTDVRLDGRVLLFTCVLSLFTCVVFGLAPMWLASFDGRLANHLRAGGRRTGIDPLARRLFGVLIVCEIALATTLLVGAGLMLRSFHGLSTVRLGFEADQRLVVQIELPPEGYPDPGRRLAFAEALQQRLRALPGVASAGLTSDIPLSTAPWDATFSVEGRPDDPADIPITSHRVVTPGYLETLGVTLLRGRLLGPEDTATTVPVVVVTRAFAERAWPVADPVTEAIGRRVGPGRKRDRWYTVVGVIDNLKEDRFNYRQDRPSWYFSLAQRDDGRPLNALLRAQAVAPATLLPGVRAAVEALDRNLALVETYTLASLVRNFLTPQRCAMLLSGLFAALGLVLAAIGTYGVTSAAVVQRTSEFGLRLALGARPGQVVAMVLRQNLRTALLGAALGIAGGILIGRALAGSLYQVRASDPSLVAGVTVLVLVMTLLAAYLPTRRVLQLDPSLVLRYE